MVVHFPRRGVRDADSRGPVLRHARRPRARHLQAVRALQGDPATTGGEDMPVHGGMSVRRTKPAAPAPEPIPSISAGIGRWTRETAESRFKIHDPPMSGGELSAIRRILGGEIEMTQEVLGEILGRFTRETVNRWERGKGAPIPPLVAREARRLRMIAEGRMAARYFTDHPEHRRR